MPLKLDAKAQGSAKVCKGDMKLKFFEFLRVLWVFASKEFHQPISWSIVPGCDRARRFHAVHSLMRAAFRVTLPPVSPIFPPASPANRVQRVDYPTIFAAQA